MRLSVLALTAALLAPALAQSAPLTTADKARIDEAVTAILKQSTTPSASIAVVKDGKVAYLHAYGLARLSPPVKATPATRYQIASVSKEIVAAAALLLQQDGKLALDDKVSKWLPGLTGGDQITLRQCLTHTAGYSDFWPQDYLMDWMEKPTTTQGILDAWAKRPLDFQPGDDWQYSNTGYVVAGAIVEKAAGMPLFDFVNTRIFKPLGITDAVDGDRTPLKAPDALGYIRPALGAQQVQKPAGKGWMFGAWPFALTAEDLARWDISLIDHTLLTPESYAQELTTAKLNNGRDTGYALGVREGRPGGRLYIHHGGEGAGYLSENRIRPDDRTAVVVLINSFSGDAQDRIATAIESALTPPTAMETQARAVFTALQHGQVDRVAFTPAFNAFLTPVAIAAYARTLGPLGEPTTFHQTGAFQRGGMTGYAFKLSAGGKALEISAFVTKDGRFEQFLVTEATN